MQDAPNFSSRYRVYWEDTDAGGVVYYANYLRFMERCRTDWLRTLGINQATLRASAGIQFAVVDLAVRYLRPALLDDEITVTARLVRLGGATIEFRQAVWRDTVQLIDADVRVASLASDSLKPCPMPKNLFMEWRNAR